MCAVSAMAVGMAKVETDEVKGCVLCAEENITRKADSGIATWTRTRWSDQDADERLRRLKGECVSLPWFNTE